MGDGTGIQWTDATWNPVRGCSRVSEGCRHCYAEAVAARFSGPGQPYEGLARRTPSGPRWTGEVRLVEPHLADPLHWKRPRKVFVNSMSDLFHEQVPDEWIDRIFAVMALAPQHTFQVLTKRPERLRAYLRDENDRDRIGIRISRQVADLTRRDLAPRGRAAAREWDEHADSVTEWTWRKEDPFVLPNVWLGVSCEDQETADERIPLLLQTPAAVRFVSAEPLLGPLTLHRWLMPAGAPGVCRDIDGAVWHEPGECPSCAPALDWVIVGGESGPGARSCDVAWVRDIVRQCRTSGVACFVKQLGADPRDRHYDMGGMPTFTDRKGGDPAEWPEDLRVREFPTSATGGER